MRFARATSIVALAVLAAATPEHTHHATGNAISIAKRSRLLNDDKTVNFAALNLHAAAANAKFGRGLHNFEKNTGSRHLSVVDGHQKLGAGLPLIDAESNTFWYGDISVGTPPKTFSVLIDTGSTDLFLPASNCHLNCGGHTLWNPATSSSAVNTDKSFSLNFGPGVDITGELYTDTVSIAGSTATHQAVGASLTYASELQPSQFPADGLMGLAFESIAAFNSTSLFGTLVDEGKVMDPVFSVKLSEKGSELFIGGSNPKLYTGEFTYTPVTKKGFWEVSMNNLQAKGKTLLKNTDVVIDTGTTVVLGPLASVAALYEELGGKLVPGNQGGDLYSSFPSVSLTFGGKSFPILESALNLGPISSGSRDCASGIMGMNLSHSSWIIGDVFLSGVYTKFDYCDLKVGFADLL